MAVEEQVYPHVATGFTDSNAYLRKLTLSSSPENPNTGTAGRRRWRTRCPCTWPRGSRTATRTCAS